MASQSKKLARLEAQARREAAYEEIRESRIHVGLGFAAAYAAEKLAVNNLPSLTPDPDSPLNAVGGVVDLALAGGGGYLAATDMGPRGDYAMGAALVGITQLLDRVVEGIQNVINKRQQ
jgi:hypothetical protein